MWDILNGRTVQLLRGHGGGVSVVDADETTLISGSVDRTVRAWDQATGASTLVMKGHDNYVCDLQFYMYALSTASADGTVRMWDRTRALRRMFFVKPLYSASQCERATAIGHCDASKGPSNASILPVTRLPREAPTGPSRYGICAPATVARPSASPAPSRATIFD